MSYVTKGKVKVVGTTLQISEKFSKREFVVTDDTNMYPQDIMFQLTQDKCNLIDSLVIGDEVEVSFNLNGREWVNPKGESKFFNTLDVWKINKIGSNAVKNAQGQGFEPKASVMPIAEEVVSNDDLLPF
jgi:hypothetical protein